MMNQAAAVGSGSSSRVLELAEFAGGRVCVVHIWCSCVVALLWWI